MTNQDEMLARARLREFGNYIMTGSDQSDYPSEPMPTARTRTYSEVKMAIEQYVPEEHQESLIEAIVLHRGVYYESGYYLGMKMGAQVLLALLNDSEIVL